MTCKINADTSNGLKLTSDTSGAVQLQSNGTTRMTVLANGNVGINVTSPTTKLDIAGNLLVDAYNAVGAGGGIFFRGGFINVNQPSITVRDHNGSAPDGLSVNGNDGITFRVASADRAVFAENGTFLIGQTTNPATATVVLKVPTGSANGVNAQITSNTGTSFPWSNYNASGAYVGGISCTSSATAFPTSSDYRLKENVSYSFDATTRMKQLKPCRFNFKIDTDNTVDGFLAHEVSSIVPEAVIGAKDATKDLGTIKDADGKVINKNIVESAREDGQTWEKTSTENDYQGIDQSKLVPLLVKTIQELEARITALES